jgi:DNA repair exonuclease SbcCD ATPase subunit
MRLTELGVAGFRAFGREQAIDLDADVVIVNGANGQGKTSLFDSLLWGLSGLVPRISTDSRVLLSKFSDTGQIEVTVKLVDNRGVSFLVRRSFDGERQRLRFESGGDASNGPDAEAKLHNLLWANSKMSADPKRNVAETLTRAVYLQQDVLREFLTKDDELSRFSSVADLIGVGQVSDLRAQLDRARTAWSTITNERSGELEQLENRLASLRNDLSRTEESEHYNLDAVAWNRWWSDASKWISGPRPTDPSEPNSSALLDRAIRTLQAQVNSLLRQRDLISSLRVDFDRNSVTFLNIDDIDNLRADVVRLQQQTKHLRDQLSIERANISALQRARLESKTQQEKVALFASLALQLLGDRCPVCTQTFDVEATRARLHALCDSPSEVKGSEAALSTTALENQLQQTEESTAAAETKLREAERGEQQRERWLATARSELVRLGIDVGDDLAEAITRASSKLEADLSSVQQIIKDGEQLSLLVLRLADRSKVKELRTQIVSLGQESNALKGDLDIRRETWHLATSILEALRESEDDVVRLQLEEINPLLQRIYSRIDPNPVFRNVSLVSNFVRRRGQLNPQVTDSATNARSNVPEQVLSSAQVNALALSLFVALNLGLPQLPLDALLMDDPMQSLDEIGLLGVADLLRRAKPLRQLIISTHEERVVALLQRKLRPAQRNDRMLTITLSGWSRRGPFVEVTAAQADLQPMKIAV